MPSTQTRNKPATFFIVASLPALVKAIVREINILVFDCKVTVL